MTNDALWDVRLHDSPSLKSALFIEGLPGIGNVGKVVVDFLIEQSKAVLIADFFSQTLPNSVFVGEDNLVQLPKIQVFHTTLSGRDVLFMSGDVQPTDEISSYSFCDVLLSYLEKWNVSEIITLGGIGLQDAPDEPEVFCTGNNSSFVGSFVKKGANPQVYGVVGPIIGVTGLLLGLASQRKLPAVALLAETLGHPMYLGLRGARSVLRLLFEVFDFSCDMNSIEQEIVEMESDEPVKNPKLDSINKLKRVNDTNYIG